MKTIIFFIMVTSTIICSQENAAIGYWKACALSSEIPQNISIESIDDTISSATGLTSQQKSWLQTNAHTVIHVVEASKLQKCGFNLSWEYNLGANILLPHLSKIMLLMRIVLLDAVRCIHEQDWKGAQERYISCLRMAFHMNQEGFLITSLVSYAVIGKTVSSFSQCLKTKNFPRKVVEKFSQEFTQVFPLVSLRNSLDNESKHFSFFYRERLKNARFEEIWKDIENMISVEKNKETRSLKKPWQEGVTETEKEKWASTLSIPVDVLESKNSLLNYFAKGVDEYFLYSGQFARFCENHYSESQHQYRKLAKEIRAKNLITKTFLDVMPIYDKGLRYHNDMRAYALLLKVTIFLKINNRFPNTLTEIWDKIPVGIINEQDFSCTRNTNNFTITSHVNIDKSISQIIIDENLNFQIIIK